MNSNQMSRSATQDRSMSTKNRAMHVTDKQNAIIEHTLGEGGTNSKGSVMGDDNQAQTQLQTPTERHDLTEDQNTRSHVDMYGKQVDFK